jgi:hypothetical protein
MEVEFLKIVGWAMDGDYKIPPIVSAIEMATRNLDLPDDAVFHSSRTEAAPRRWHGSSEPSYTPNPESGHMAGLGDGD